MRCRECNVDLPENYTACPLCGAKTHTDAPTIEGIRYSECPRVETEKYKRNPFLVFLALWAAVSVTALVLLRTSLVSATVAAAVFCVPAVLWTLVGRPLLVRQLYVGNFVVMNVWPAALTSFVFGRLTGAAADGFAVWVPLCCAVLLLALFVTVFAVPRHAKRAAPYAVLFIAASLVGLCAVAVRYAVFAPCWLVSAALGVALLAVLLLRDKKAVCEELAAKFSVQ